MSKMCNLWFLRGPEVVECAILVLKMRRKRGKLDFFATWAFYEGFNVLYGNAYSLH